jgi:hypothetical protein
VRSENRAVADANRSGEPLWRPTLMGSNGGLFGWRGLAGALGVLGTGRIRSSTMASVGAALQATIRMPIFLAP